MRSVAALLGVAGLLAATPVGAHHSGAMFDGAKTLKITGSVKDVAWTNPHAWLSIIAAPGQPEAGRQWDFETLGPGMLSRMGLTKARFGSGEAITIEYHPLRDGRRGGSLISITFANGETSRLGASFGGPGPGLGGPPDGPRTGEAPR